MHSSTAMARTMTSSTRTDWASRRSRLALPLPEIRMTDFFLDEGRLYPSDAAVALIVVGDERQYLMQLRDQKPGIFYPGHWGLFGGATDPGETQERALLRELKEELNLDLEEIRYFTEFVFDFGFAGFGKFKRSFYEVKIERHAVDSMRLGEGAA